MLSPPVAFPKPRYLRRDPPASPSARRLPRRVIGRIGWYEVEDEHRDRLVPARPADERQPGAGGCGRGGRGRPRLLLRARASGPAATLPPTATPTCWPRCGSSTRACERRARRLHYRSGDRRGCRSRGWPGSAAPGAVHVNRDHTAHSRARDRRVAGGAGGDEVELVGHTGLTCAEIAADRDRLGRSLPGLHALLTGLGEGPAARPAPSARASSARRAGVAAGSILERGRARRRRRAPSGSRRPSAPGEEAARKLMRKAVAGADDYARVRDLPGEDATTHLSPALHFGTVSPRESRRCCSTAAPRARRAPPPARLARLLAQRDPQLPREPDGRARPALPRA